MADKPTKPVNKLDSLEFWLGEVKAYEDTFKAWEGRCEKILKRYRDERNSQELVRNVGGYRYNLYWSNCQMKTPLLYSQTPKNQVERRHKVEGDDLALEAAQMLEEAEHYNIAEQDFDLVMDQAVADYMHCARGQAWLRYVPTFGPAVIGQDEKGNPIQEKVAEAALVDYVHY